MRRDAFAGSMLNAFSVCGADNKTETALSTSLDSRLLRLVVLTSDYVCFLQYSQVLTITYCA